MPLQILSTGQTFCADATGATIPCKGTGQDAEFAPGHPFDETRFQSNDATVTDTLTGLTWLRNANAPGFPITWQEAFAFIESMNRDRHANFDDWRLPDRRELFSLISFDTHSPALPKNHPFTHVFNGWYWSSTPSAMHQTQVWHVQMTGGRMFWGNRTGYELVWPVRGSSNILPDIQLKPEVDAALPGQRFMEDGGTVHDTFTGLSWTQSADITSKSVVWTEAFAAIDVLNRQKHAGIDTWRLPSIRELESLTDVTRHTPALTPGHPFNHTCEAYWSATNSAYEHDWAMCYYLHKGAVGVGFKPGDGFHVWGVSSAA